MRMCKARNIFLILLLVMLSACGSGSEKGDKVCLFPDGRVTDGKGGTNETTKTLQSMGDFVKEKKVISTIVNKIKTDLFGSSADGGKAAQMFIAIASDANFQSAITAAFILFVTFYGLGVVGGYVQASTGDAVIRVAKMAFIATMAMSWGEFYSFVGSFFMDGRDELMAYLMEGFAGVVKQNVGAGLGQPALTTDAIFGGMDDLVAKVFSPHMFATLAALFDMMGQNSGPYAIGYALVLFMGLLALLRAILNVVTVYVFSLFANVILFAIAPIYLAFLLFEKTKPMFDSWLKQLINFNLQPILAVLFLALFLQVMGPFLDEILGNVISNAEGGTPQDKGSNWRFTSSDCTTALTFGGQTAPPISLQTLLLFVFFAWCFKAYIEIATAISTGLTESFTNLSNIGGQMFSKLQQGMGKLGGKQ